MTKAPEGRPGPFSRVLVVATLSDRPIVVPVEADAAERARLAEANGIPALHRLEVPFRVGREGPSGFRVSGTLQATVRQICVVTLEPFDSEVTEEVDVRFVLDSAASGRSSLRAPTAPQDPAEEADEDPPDVIRDGRIDLGALAAEFLALGLDPHPRKPGVRFDEAAAGQGPKEASPFAVLAALKPGRPPGQ